LIAIVRVGQLGPHLQHVGEQRRLHLVLIGLHAQLFARRGLAHLRHGDERPLFGKSPESAVDVEQRPILNVADTELRLFDRAGFSCKIQLPAPPIEWFPFHPNTDCGQIGGQDIDVEIRHVQDGEADLRNPIGLRDPAIQIGLLQLEARLPHVGPVLERVRLRRGEIDLERGDRRHVLHLERRAHITSEQLVQLLLLRRERVLTRRPRELLLRQANLHLERVGPERNPLGDADLQKSVELSVERERVVVRGQGALGLQNRKIETLDAIDER
jgi:hypothetical protein